jgi:hypothetical protein
VRGCGCRGSLKFDVRKTIGIEAVVRFTLAGGAARGGSSSDLGPGPRNRSASSAEQEHAGRDVRV